MASLQALWSVAVSTRIKSLSFFASHRDASGGWQGAAPPRCQEVVLVEVVCRRCAGIDVSKRDAKVCVRVQGQGSAKTTARVSTWSSVMPQVVKLREQLIADGVELVVIESTSDYWRPFFYVLSEAVPVMLVKASEVKGMPGRKTDVSDADTATKTACAPRSRITPVSTDRGQAPVRPARQSATACVPHDGRHQLGQSGR